MPVATPSSHVTPKSTLRYRPIAPDVKAKEPPRVPRASRTQTQKPKTTSHMDVPAWKSSASLPAPRSQQVPLVAIGIGMLLAVMMVLMGQLLMGWFSTSLDDLHYGRPRTFQVDAFVGHESAKVASHFIALNLHGHIEIIELPGGDTSHAKIYQGPHLYGPNADLTPVTLQFVDSRHDHHPDMIVLFHSLSSSGTTNQIVFHNDGSSFRSP